VRSVVSVSRGGEIEVILPGTDFCAVYYKPTREPNSSLKGRRTGATNLRHVPGGRPAKWHRNSTGLTVPKAR
jgi:hypothetical protein